jgi:hypothetical protein
MSVPSVICYPYAFLERPEDRSLLFELTHAGLSEDQAKLILYRIWAEFATGGSDRRRLESEDMAAERQVRMMEAFCHWSGGPGELVRLAVLSGFLRIDRTDDGVSLICVGFYPINSAWSKDGRSFQRSGGLSRSLTKKKEKVDQDAGKREELWERTQADPFPDVAPEVRREALRFAMLLCRAVGFPYPTDGELAAGVMRMAIETVTSCDEAQRRETMLWITGRRKEQDMPTRLDAILREWPSFVAKAAGEMN